MEKWLFKLKHRLVWKAQPRQRVSNIYIHLYASYQSVSPSYYLHDVQVDSSKMSNSYPTMDFYL